MRQAFAELGTVGRNSRSVRAAAVQGAEETNLQDWFVRLFRIEAIDGLEWQVAAVLRQDPLTPSRAEAREARAVGSIGPSHRRCGVLFHTMWEFHPSNSEEAIQRNLAFFSQWKPPDGFEFKGFWGFADGSGGVAIVETDSAATLAKATAPFTPWLQFSTTPILPIEEASAIAGEAAAARASFGG
jgi:hypothetical protein